MLQDIDKMKVQYLMSLLFDLFEILRIEVGDGSFFFCIFHALSFELNFFFDRRFPLKSSNTGCPQKRFPILNNNNSRYI